MNVHKIPFEETGLLSQMFLDYIRQKPELKDYYSFSPSIEGLEAALKTRQFSKKNRLILHEVLMEQYGPLAKREANFSNILSLQEEHTFTVTTGHQLNIFTGPLYVIFKIISAINLAKKLKAAFPDYNFVPVYWMASEDHDFEEINHFHLFGKKYVWETEQRGPVGRFAPQSLNFVMEQLPEFARVFEHAYLDHSTLAESVRFYMHELFGDQGLVVVDADHERLKQLFSPIIEADLFEQKSNDLVEETSARLSNAGYSTQVFPRKINFFYLNGFRERIVEVNGVFSVNNTDLTFTKEELREDLKRNPQRFSPNVIMRPLYQEVILPNIAYLGGPSEVTYWLQLKDNFDHFNIAFPVLLARNFAMIVNKGLSKKVKKLSLPATSLFKSTHELKAWYLEHFQKNEHLLDKEKAEINDIFDRITTKAATIDKSLEGFIGAEGAKTYKSVDNIQKRLKKSLENQNELAMNQISGIKEKLFPNGVPQERYDNYLNFALNNPNFIQTLLDNFDPLEFSYYQFWET